MLPEIELVRSRTDKIWTPSELANRLSNKSEGTIRQNLRRALQRKQIIEVGYGEYAHPSYQSSVPAPKSKQSQSEWKDNKYTILIQVCLNTRVLIEYRKLDYKMEEYLYQLIEHTLDKDTLKIFRTHLEQAASDLDVDLPTDL